MGNEWCRKQSPCTEEGREDAYLWRVEVAEELNRGEESNTFFHFIWSKKPWVISNLDYSKEREKKTVKAIKFLEKDEKNG